MTNNVTYEYDPQGRRSAKDVDATRTEYLLDEGEEIAEYNGATLLRRFVYDKGIDKPIAMIDEPSGDRFYYHQNRLGSVIAFADDTGTVIEPYTYSPYGISTSSFVGNPFRYTGRRLDEETGLYYYRARYYSPAIGRFLQTDPIGYEDDLNLYAYTGNDPINLTDPSGKYVQVIVAAGRACGSNPSCVSFIASGIGALYYVINQVTNDPPQPVPNVPDTPDVKPPAPSKPKEPAPPFKGEPGTGERQSDEDGGPNQDCVYGDDGFPETDVDYGHDHDQGVPHIYDWGRPEGGRPPRAEDRKPGRPPNPGELEEIEDIIKNICRANPEACP